MSPLVGRPPTTQVNLPGASPEELELMRSQNAFLQQQLGAFGAERQQAAMFQPFLLSQLGAEEIRDASGNITGYRPSAGLLQQQQIESKLRERSLAALEGNLPVDPGLERNLSEGRLDLQEQLRRQLGPGFETSTPGIQALAEFDKRAEELRYGARTGMLTTAEGLAGAREARGLQRAGTLGSAGQFSLPFTQTGATLSQAFSSPLNRMLQERQSGLEAQKISTGNEFNVYQEKLGFAGTALGAIAGAAGAAGGFGALFSDRRVKKDVHKVGETKSGLPVYTFKYKGDDTTRMGVMAQDVERKLPKAVLKTSEGIRLVDYSKIK